MVPPPQSAWCMTSAHPRTAGSVAVAVHKLCVYLEQLVACLHSQVTMEYERVILEGLDLQAPLRQEVQAAWEATAKANSYSTIRVTYCLAVQQAQCVTQCWHRAGC
eukprot:GHUV01033515.1.p1 GENE.GHUV01033515.1~~GHUV01033515.1.p1  ORF type:complete len:106 (-),score=18.90 GHUV01033515.1:316-633(-)